jgi:hypothetical protein
LELKDRKKMELRVNKNQNKSKRMSRKIRGYDEEEREEVVVREGYVSNSDEDSGGRGSYGEYY